MWREVGRFIQVCPAHVFRVRIRDVTGTLGLFSLVDLFQLFASSARTGRLTVDHPKGTAKVYFETGRVVHAEFASRTGIEAIYLLFSDEKGKFDFRAGMPVGERTIELSTENLLLEVIRRLDESKKPSESKGNSPDAAVPVLTEKMSNTNLTLYDKEILVLRVVDGEKNLQQIAEEIGLELDLVKQITNRLMRVGALTFKGNKLKTARLYAQSAKGNIPQKTVGLDSNLLSMWGMSLGHNPTRIACRRPDGKVYVFHVQEMDNIGANILFSKDTLYALDLTANTELLVKPVD